MNLKIKYQTKTEIVEALQLQAGEKSRAEIQALTDGIAQPAIGGSSMSIPTFNGDHAVAVGDWVIKGKNGVVSSCGPGVFAATYDRIE